MKTEKNIPHRHPSARPTDALFQELSATLLADEFRLLHELEGLSGPTGIDRAAVAAYVRMTMEALASCSGESRGDTVQVQGNSSGTSLGLGFVPSFTARNLFEIWVGKEASNLLFSVAGLWESRRQKGFPGRSQEKGTGKQKNLLSGKKNENFLWNPSDPCIKLTNSDKKISQIVRHEQKNTNSPLVTPLSALNIFPEGTIQPMCRDE